MTTTLIFVMYLVLMVLVGFVASKYIKEENFMVDFYTAGRSLGPIIIGLTVISSFVSGGAIIATPGTVYEMGYSTVLYESVSVAYALVVVGVVGLRVAQLGRRFNAVSMPDLFRKRYGDTAALICTVLILLVLFPYMAVQFIGVSRVLQAVVGLDFSLGVLITAGVVLVYISFGGMLAQAWTNTIQALIMITAVLLGAIGVLWHFGGFTPLTEALAARGPDFVNAHGNGNWLPTALYSFTYSPILVGFATFGAPHVVTRFFALRDTRNFKLILIISAVACFIWFPLLQVVGAGSVAMFPNLEHSDLAFPALATQLFHPLLAGIVLAGIAAAMMSTVDAMLITVSVSVTRDLFQRLRPDASPKLLRLIGTLSTVVAAAGAAVIALNPPSYILAIVQVALAGLACTFAIPLLGALYWPRATGRAAAWSMIMGFTVLYLLYLPGPFQHPLGIHAAGWGVTASLVSLVAVSLLSEKPSQKLVAEFYT